MGKVGAGNQAESSNIEDDQPWLTQEIPELTAKSSNSICFKGEGLCVIYLKDGEASPAEIEMLTGLSKKFTSQLSDRGAKMKFMWINLAIETAFKDLFKPAQARQPRATSRTTKSRVTRRPLLFSLTKSW